MIFGTLTNAHKRELLLRISALSGMSFLAGCSTPDNWFNEPLPEVPAAFENHYIEPVAATVALQSVNETPPPLIADDDGILHISLEQSLMLALSGNRDLRIQQLNPVIASAAENIERGLYDPEIFALVEASEEFSLQTDQLTQTEYSFESRDNLARLGIRQRLPTGTDIEASVTQDSSFSVSTSTREQQRAVLGLSVTQSLLQGFGPSVNLATIRQAELNTLASFYELRAFAENLVANTEIAYWQFVLAEEQIAIFESSLALAKKQMNEVAQRIEVGRISQSEAAATQAAVSLREQDLIDARSDREERRLQLLRLIQPNVPDPFALQITAGSIRAIEPHPIDNVDERIALAEQSRPDLNEARLRLEQGRLETVITRNGLLPRLDFFVALQQIGYGNPENTAAASFRNINGDNYNLSGGLRLSHYIGNRAAQSIDLAARASRQQAYEALENLRQNVHLNLRLSLNEVERTRQQISASEATRNLQEMSLRAEEERFAVGSGTSLLVAQAQRDLLASQIAQVEAIINYRIALVQLYLAEGSLLERRGVNLRDTRNSF